MRTSTAGSSSDCSAEPGESTSSGVQDVGLRTAGDPEVLQWAADEGRVLLTHDIATMPDFAYERITAGLPVPGVFVVRATLALASAIEELSLIAEVSDSDEWRGQVVYLPLR